MPNVELAVSDRYIVEERYGYIDGSGGLNNGNHTEDWPVSDESEAPRSFVRNLGYDRVCAALAGSDNDHVDGAIDDPVGYSGDRTLGGAGDPGAAEGRCGVHQL